MSKKIALRVPVTVMVRDRDIAVLAIIERAAGGRGREVSLGLKHIASELEASLDTARRAVNACRDAGYLEVTPAGTMTAGTRRTRIGSRSAARRSSKLLDKLDCCSGTDSRQLRKQRR